jgi:hypothetical protein
MADAIIGGAIVPLLMPLNRRVATAIVRNRTGTLPAFNAKPSVKSFSDFQGREKKGGKLKQLAL